MWNIKLNNLTSKIWPLCGVGVGETPREVYFQSECRSRAAEFCFHSWFGATVEKKRITDSGEEVRSFPIRILTLSDIFALFGIRQVDVMHINCMGCEREVFGSQSWKTLRPFIGEISGEFTYSRHFLEEGRDLLRGRQSFHFATRKECGETLKLLLHKNQVDNFTRVFVETFEIWRNESAEVFSATEFEEGDEANPLSREEETDDPSVMLGNRWRGLAERFARSMSVEESITQAEIAACAERVER